jgi:hypothetical protein
MNTKQMILMGLFSFGLLTNKPAQCDYSQAKVWGLCASMVSAVASYVCFKEYNAAKEKIKMHDRVATKFTEIKGKVDTLSANLEANPQRCIDNIEIESAAIKTLISELETQNKFYIGNILYFNVLKMYAGDEQMLKEALAQRQKGNDASNPRLRASCFRFAHSFFKSWVDGVKSEAEIVNDELTRKKTSLESIKTCISISGIGFASLSVMSAAALAIAHYWPKVRA